MLNSLICGSFHSQEDEDEIRSPSPCTTPTRKSRNKKDKNPYATRGLDKFSALLSELEEKRQQIYSQAGSQDISFVRFVYSSSNDFVPVIVKMKDPQTQRNSIDHNKENDHKISTIREDKVQVVNEETRMELDQAEKKIKEKNKKKVYLKWRRPSVYMPLFVILILVFLAVFGRSVAILCTSVGWYLVPTLSSNTSVKQADWSSNKMKKKKELLRRFSEVGPRVNDNIIVLDGKDLKSPHGRQNSF